MARREQISVLGRAKASGFTLSEISVLFNDQGTHSIKWQQLAARKVAELDATLERIAAMKDLLLRRCQCATATECGRRIRDSKRGRELAV